MQKDEKDMKKPLPGGSGSLFLVGSGHQGL
jgi:hypothetical protein